MGILTGYGAHAHTFRKKHDYANANQLKTFGTFTDLSLLTTDQLGPSHFLTDWIPVAKLSVPSP